MRSADSAFAVAPRSSATPRGSTTLCAVPADAPPAGCGLRRRERVGAVEVDVGEVAVVAERPHGVPDGRVDHAVGLLGGLQRDGDAPPRAAGPPGWPCPRGSREISESGRNRLQATSIAASSACSTRSAASRASGSSTASRAVVPRAVTTVRAGLSVRVMTRRRTRPVHRGRVGERRRGAAGRRFLAVSGTVSAACTGAAGAGFGAADSAANAWANRDPKKTASAVPPAAVTVVAPTTRRRPAARGSTA